MGSRAGPPCDAARQAGGTDCPRAAARRGCCCRRGPAPRCGAVHDVRVVDDVDGRLDGQAGDVALDACQCRLALLLEADLACRSAPAVQHRQQSQHGHRADVAAAVPIVRQATASHPPIAAVVHAPVVELLVEIFLNVMRW